MRFLPLAVLMLALAGPAAAEHVSTGEIRWACGFNGSGQRGHPDGCGIDPIGGEGVDSEGTPEWGPAWVDDDEPVLGIVVDGDARAVPVVMLDAHEIVNDRIGGRDVAITYCPLCGSGVAFDRTVFIDGATRTLTFAASGFLYQSDLVMWDPETSTLWNQITGSAIASLVDRRVEAVHHEATLATVPLVVTSWGEWREQHGGATMLQKVRAGYGSAYAGYDSSSGQCGLGTCIGVDERLHPKELVIGVTEPSPWAFPLFGVQAAGGVVVHAGLVVTATPGGAHAVHDASGYEFTRMQDGWVDANGTRWNLQEGRSEHGATLPPVDSVRLYWFAWAEHHPDTDLWQPTNASSELERDNGKLLGFTIPIVAGVLLLIAIFWRRR